MKYLRRIIASTLFVVVAYAVVSADSSTIALYETLFFIDASEYSPRKLNLTKYPESVRSRLIEYQERASNFRSRLKRPKGTWEEQMSFEKKIALEHGLVALISGAGIEKIAADYAKKAPLAYEWEGFSDGPLAEARFAENFLKRNPNTVLKPYLLLFLTHRYRIAYECLDYEKKYKEQMDASRKYNQYLEKAKNSNDPLVALIAADIDKHPYLYIKTEKHP